MDSKTWMMNGRKKYLTMKKSLKHCKDSSLEELLNAIEAFRKMDKELKDLQCQESDMFQISVISALLNYEIGLILNRVKYSKEAKKYFLKSKDLIYSHAMKEECITLIIMVFLQLCKLWSGANEYSRTWDTFRTAFELFEQHKKRKVTALEDLFLQAHEREIKRSDLTLLSLSSPRGIKGIELLLSSDFTDFISSEFKKTFNKENFNSLLYIVFRSCHIAGYLSTEGYFQFARYILVCVNKIATDGENKFSDGENSLKRQKLNSLKSFICFVQFIYAEFLLKISKRVLKPETPDDYIVCYSYQLKHSRNELLVKDDINRYGDEIPLSFATNFEEAKKIFQFGSQSLKEGSLMGSETCRKEIFGIIKYSDLCTTLIKFVEDPYVECDMNMMKIKLLETALAEAAIKECRMEYQEAVLKICATYHDMLIIAYNELTGDETKLTSENISRIDSLVSKAILFYEKHISTFNSKNGGIPENMLNKRATNLSIALQGTFGKVHALISAYSKTIENLIKDKLHGLNKDKLHESFDTQIIDIIADLSTP